MVVQRERAVSHVYMRDRVRGAYGLVAAREWPSIEADLAGALVTDEFRFPNVVWRGFDREAWGFSG